MRVLFSFLVGLVAFAGLGASVPAQAKGFLARGTYEGKGTSGTVFRISFDTVALGSTTTVVTGCNFEMQCGRVAKVKLSDHLHSVTALDFYASAETYDRSGWGVTYGMIGPRRVYYSLFSLKMQGPLDEVMTLVVRGETVQLKRVSNTDTR